MVCLCSRKHSRITPLLSQKTVHIALPDGNILNISDGEFRLPLHGLLFDSSTVVTSHRVTSKDAVQETPTSSFTLAQQVLTNLHMLSFSFSVSIRRIHLVQNSAVFQHCHHHFQLTEANIQLHTKFLNCNSPVHMNELIKTVFILQYGSWVWPSNMWHFSIVQDIIDTEKVTNEIIAPLVICQNYSYNFWKFYSRWKAVFVLLIFGFFLLRQFNDLFYLLT